MNEAELNKEIARLRRRLARERDWRTRLIRSVVFGSEVIARLLDEHPGTTANAEIKALIEDYVNALKDSGSTISARVIEGG